MQLSFQANAISTDADMAEILTNKENVQADR